MLFNQFDAVRRSNRSLNSPRAIGVTLLRLNLHREAYEIRWVAESESRIAQEVLQEGRQFYFYVEQQDHGFSGEEASTARSKFDHKLRMIVCMCMPRRQQEHFSKLQRVLKTSHDEETQKPGSFSDDDFPGGGSPDDDDDFGSGKPGGPQRCGICYLLKGHFDLLILLS
eukprot:5966269-Amphidinium_carterae.1